MTQFLAWLFTPWLVISTFRTPAKFSIWLPLGPCPSSLSPVSQLVQRPSAVLLMQGPPLSSSLIFNRYFFSTPSAMIFIPKNCRSISFAVVCGLLLGLLPGFSDKDLGKDDV